MRHLAPALAALLILAAPAAAEERRISKDYGERLTAQGPYVSWSDINQTKRVLWRSGRVSPFPFPWDTELGSDASGRAVGVYTACGADGGNCAVRSRVVGGSGSRVLYRRRGGDPMPAGAMPAGDMHRGMLALVAGGRTRGLYVRRPGSSRTRRVDRSKGNAWRVSAGPGSAGWLTHFGDRDELRVVRLAGGRARVFAINDTYDEDCRCMPESRIVGPALSGRYVYWLETFSPQHMTGDPTTARTRIGRARIDLSRPKVAYYDTAGVAGSFAIRGSRIVYNRLGGFGPPGEPGVYEVIDPDWRPSGTRIPART